MDWKFSVVMLLPSMLILLVVWLISWLCIDQHHFLVSSVECLYKYEDKSEQFGYLCCGSIPIGFGGLGIELMD